MNDNEKIALNAAFKAAEPKGFRGLLAKASPSTRLTNWNWFRAGWIAARRFSPRLLPRQTKVPGHKFKITALKKQEILVCQCGKEILLHAPESSVERRLLEAEHFLTAIIEDYCPM